VNKKNSLHCNPQRMKSSPGKGYQEMVLGHCSTEEKIDCIEVKVYESLIVSFFATFDGWMGTCITN
jgi:hypothetical protein